MSLPQHGRRQLTPCLSQLPKHNHIWISDRFLDDAWRHFVRQQRHSHSRQCPASLRRNLTGRRSPGLYQATSQTRHGSSTPGPLEARKRASKKSMTGVAYDHNTTPSDYLPPGFSLRSWLPVRWGSPAERMKWEPPDRNIWGSTGNGNSTAETSGFQQNAIALDVRIPERDALPMAEGQISDDDNVFSKTDRLRDLLIQMDFRDLSSFLTHEIGHQHHEITTEHASIIMDHLVSEAEIQRDPKSVTSVLDWLVSWLRSPSTREMLNISFLRKVIFLAPGKNMTSEDAIAQKPIRQMVYTKLCLSTVRSLTQNEALCAEVLESTTISQGVAFVLAKTDLPDWSCQLASELFSQITVRSEAEAFMRTFLQEYAFQNSGRGPFHQGISIHRCVPLAGLLKRLSIEEGASRLIQAVTIQRLNTPAASVEHESATHIDYWFKALRLGEVKLAKSARDIIIRALVLMDQPQLLADFLSPLPVAERCSALLGAWVPKSSISWHGNGVLLQRRRVFEAGPETLDDAESYWTSRTPYLSMFEALYRASPMIAQEHLTKILHLCQCSQEYSAISQIANFLRTKKKLIPRHVLQLLLQSLTPQVPLLARHLLDHDPRALTIESPEHVVKMIEAGVPGHKIQHFLRAAAGLDKVSTGSWSWAARQIDEETNELLCRAAHAWVMLPLSESDVQETTATMSTGDKFYNILRIIALFVKQPEVLDERIVGSLYQVVVSEPILTGRPVSRWRLRVANSISRLYGEELHDMMRYYTTQADAHNIALDLESPEIQEQPQVQQDTAVEAASHERIVSGFDELADEYDGRDDTLTMHIKQVLQELSESKQPQTETQEGATWCGHKRSAEFRLAPCGGTLKEANAQCI